MEQNDAVPKKYVRTFAGDIRTVKKGGSPDLVPLEETEQTPDDEENLSPIKTYSGDFAQRVKETGASTATIIAAEQDAPPQFEEAVATEGPKKIQTGNIIYVAAGTILLVVGLVGSYIAYTRYMIKVTPVAVEPSIRSPIFVDESEQISGNGKTLLRAVEQSATRPLASGAVRHLYLDPAIVAAGSVFYELNLPAPNVLLRNISKDGSMAGIVNPAPTSTYGTGGKQNPFFILSVSSYGDTFSGMLSWEQKMPSDLSVLFPPFVEEKAILPVSTTTVVTPTQPTQLIQPSFHDETAANHDVRVYRDSENRSVFLYGYWNQTTLIIARDPAAFIEIASRLATSRAQR
jgi:hypothetical protein